MTLALCIANLSGAIVRYPILNVSPCFSAACHLFGGVQLVDAVYRSLVPTEAGVSSLDLPGRAGNRSLRFSPFFICLDWIRPPSDDMVYISV